LKVKSVSLSRSKTAAEIDLFEGIVVPRSARAKIKENVGEYLVTEVNRYLAEQKSPVNGRTFKRLSTPYAAEKKEEVGNTDANLELTGSMRDQIDYRMTGSGIEFGVFGTSAPKADGHNNLSGESTLPLRQFIPGEGQSFTPQIRKDIAEIIRSTIADEADLTAEDFEQVKSKTELYSVLGQVFQGLSRQALRETVLGSESLVQAMTRAGVLDLL